MLAAEAKKAGSASEVRLTPRPPSLDWPGSTEGRRGQNWLCAGLPV